MYHSIGSFRQTCEKKDSQVYYKNRKLYMLHSCYVHFLCSLFIFRNLKSKLDETTVTQIYPGVFKSETEQRKILERYFKSFYYNRTIVNDTFLAEQACAFSCGFIPQLGRKKRFSTGSFVYHGCCKS